MAREDSLKVKTGKWRHSSLARVGMIVLIFLPGGAALFFASRNWLVPQDVLKLGAVIIMSLFLPLLAYSFFFFREERRIAELDRIFNKLDLKDEATYIRMFREVRSGPSFCLSVGLAWTVSLAGLIILFLGEKVGIDEMAPFEIGDQRFPIDGSRLMFGMAFLGAYLWGLQFTFRRYMVNDLLPGVFYSLGYRMVMAATLALLIYNAFASLAGAEADGSGPSGLQATVWPALAFLIGAFPQRGLQWLMARVPIFSSKPDPSVRPLPLDMIEGIGSYDQMRLEELGIESCHDLANADFIPMVLKTSYSARELTDWILQAKLFVVCGEAVKDLRQQGVRNILALADMKKDEVLELAKQTSASESSLKRAQEYAARDPEIARLRAVSSKLGQYTVLPENADSAAE